MIHRFRQLWVVFAALSAGLPTGGIPAVGAAPPAGLSIAAPQHKAVYTVGDTIDIDWRVEGDPGLLFSGGVILEFSLNRGRSWICITCTTGSIMPDEELWGHFPWPVPARVCNLNFDRMAGGDGGPCPMISTVHDSVIIRIVDYFSASDYWKSPPFSITAPPGANGTIPWSAARSAAPGRSYRKIIHCNSLRITSGASPRLWSPSGRIVAPLRPH